MSLICIQDLHLKNEQPFLYHQIKFIDWLKQFNGEEMFFLGDIFNDSVPAWSVFSLFKEFLLQRKNKTYLLQGNHCLSKRKGSAISPFRLLPNIKVFLEEEEFLTLDGFRCLALPYKYTMDSYNNIQFTGDFCFTHTMPKEEAFSNEYIDLSHINAYLIYGHIHTRRTIYDNKFIPGVPILTKKGEQNNPIFKIKEDKTFEDIPTEVDFAIEQIEFGQPITNKFNIYEILNSPDTKSIFEQYKDFHIRLEGCTYTNHLTEQEVEAITLDSIGKEFKQFCVQELIEQSIIDKGLTYFNQISVNQ